MKLKGIIITGTSGSGKFDIINELIKTSNKYEWVKPITVYDEDDNYNLSFYTCVDSLNYECLRPLIWRETKKSKKKQSILKTEIERAIGTRKYIVILIQAELFHEMSEQEREGFLSFFIDASDERLDERLEKRNKKPVSKEIRNQRIIDRKYADDPDYIVQNDKSDKAVKLIDRLVNLYREGSFLAQRDIKLMIQNGMLIKGAMESNIKGASYDLRLGAQYYYGGKIEGDKDRKYILTIEPYDYAIVSSEEEICLPKDVVAHFGLTVGLFCQGIILSNGQQVDPGFRGILFCLLFNTSNKPVTIKCGQHYATIEFTKMNEFASGYKGKYQEKKNIIDVIPANSMQGAINELKKEIEALRNESRNMQNIYISVISIIIAALSVLLILN